MPIFPMRRFPYGTAKEIDFAYARPWALRMSYVGELGWELYIPSMFAPAVFDAVMAEGKQFGLHLVGMQAVNSLRLETGYRHWESDITPDDTPYEAGLSFGVKLDKPDFRGRDALLSKKEAGLTRRLVMFTPEDPEIMLYGSEPLYRDGLWMNNRLPGPTASRSARPWAWGMSKMRITSQISGCWTENMSSKSKVK